MYLDAALMLLLRTLSTLRKFSRFSPGHFPVVHGRAARAPRSQYMVAIVPQAFELFQRFHDPGRALRRTSGPELQLAGSSKEREFILRRHPSPSRWNTRVKLHCANPDLDTA